jgi:23S rRNA pseudouridine2605 synthase
MVHSARGSDVRLHRYLARAGVASRRAAEDLIAAGRVRVNGDVVTKPGTLAGERDRVEVDGVPVQPHPQAAYLLLHKPVKVVTTMRDPQGRRTVAELLPKGSPRVVPVGRLDYDTSGVLLLTNDGELAHLLTHPSFGVEKTYRATVRGRLTPEAAGRLAAGVRLEEFKAAGARVRLVSASRDRSVLDVTIHEGKNRQVRRMLEAVNHPVLSLTRLRFGPLTLGSLPPGRVRPLTPRELGALRRIAERSTARRNQ